MSPSETASKKRDGELVPRALRRLEARPVPIDVLPRAHRELTAVGLALPDDPATSSYP